MRVADPKMNAKLCINERKEGKTESFFWKIHFTNEKVVLVMRIMIDEVVIPVLETQQFVEVQLAVILFFGAGGVAHRLLSKIK